MATLSAIKGVILEEALLRLLAHSGYKVVDSHAKDECLGKCAAGLQVRGRGANHQIDAIADFIVPQPFSFPQRLLVEAKCYKEKIGLPLMRSALGVYKDVNEFLTSTQSRGYHYSFAYFSTSEYTRDAQNFAQAHDIFLIPLAASKHMSPMLRVLDELRPHDFRRGGRGTDIAISLKELRLSLRRALLHQNPAELESYFADNRRAPQLLAAEQRIGFALMATLDGRFTVFLVPAPGVEPGNLPDSLAVRFFFNRAGGLFESDGRELFSFDLPSEIFSRLKVDASERYGVKAEIFGSVRAVWSDGDNFKVITLRIDNDWLAHERESIRRAARGVSQAWRP